jgi:hypothetical protein
MRVGNFQQSVTLLLALISASLSLELTYFGGECRGPLKQHIQVLSNYNCQIKHCGQEVFEDAPSVGSGRFILLDSHWFQPLLIKKC